MNDDKYNELIDKFEKTDDLSDDEMYELEDDLVETYIDWNMPPM